MWTLFIAITITFCPTAVYSKKGFGAQTQTSTHNCSNFDVVSNKTVTKCHSCYYCEFTIGKVCNPEDFERCPVARESSPNNKCFVLKEFTLNAKGVRGEQIGIQKGCLHSYKLPPQYKCPRADNPHPSNLPNITLTCCAGMNCNEGVSIVKKNLQTNLIIFLPLLLVTISKQISLELFDE